MEARANHLWVGIVTLLLLAGLAAAIVWIANLWEGDEDQYDILYSQSVAGLSEGSTVTFSGVPVGEVKDIIVSNPEFVRVRIAIRDDVPIVLGTKATIQASFTGGASILLEGAKANQPDVDCDNSACTFGKPIIPAGTGVFGKLVADAPLILERIATVTERLNQVLSDENQERLSSILRNSDRLSGGLADATPELTTNLREFRSSMGEFNRTMESLQKLAGTTEGVVTKEGQALSAELKATLARANTAADALTKSLEQVQPVTDDLRQTTLPAAEATLQDLRSTSRSLRAITERLEQDGIGSLIGDQPLPDYNPNPKKKGR
jgi:phospholipid/cholesterol/gamma-HCH transport system substrate-binding protein